LEIIALDIKRTNTVTYRKLTSWNLEPTLDFARRRAGMGEPMWIRSVLVPGWTDAEADILRLADFIVTLGTAVQRIEVLSFHQMGAHKSQELGLHYQLKATPSATPADAETARSLFAGQGLNVC
jgi:pyruvate formate lyase activating enzyme